MTALFIILAVLANLIHAADCLQTRHIADSAGKYVEANPLLIKLYGAQPTGKQVLLYFVGTFVVLNALALLFGAFMGSWLYAAVVVVDGYVVYHNYKLGLKL